jgi:uncharacterized protein YcfL
MKKLFLFLFLIPFLVACTSQDSTQNIRDNETPVMAEDQVDNQQMPKDTILLSDSIQTPLITN